MPVPSQESGRSCVCVILPHSTIVLLDLDVFRKSGIFCFSFYRHFYEKNLKKYNMSQYYLISITIFYVYSKLVHDYFLILYWGRRGRYRMLVGSTTTYAIGAYLCRFKMGLLFSSIPVCIHAHCICYGRRTLFPADKLIKIF